MRLPALTEFATAKDNTEEFKGYDHNLRVEAGAWYDQKNMTTDYYPLASPRSKRALQSDYSSLIKVPTMFRKWLSGNTAPDIGYDVIEDYGSHKAEFYTIKTDNCKAAWFIDNSLVCLHEMSGKYIIPHLTSSANYKGKWLTKNKEALGDLGICTAEDVEVNFNVSNYTCTLYSQSQFYIQSKNIRVNNVVEVIFRGTNYLWKIHGKVQSIVGDPTNGYTVTLQYCGIDGFVDTSGMITVWYQGGYNENDISEFTDSHLSSNIEHSGEIKILNVSAAQNFLDKAQEFSNTSDVQKDYLIKVGAYLCAIPDGEIYETQRTYDNLSVRKIRKTYTTSNGSVYTFVKNGDKNNPLFSTTSVGKTEEHNVSSYSPPDGIFFEENMSPTATHRYENKKFETYLAKDKTWVSDTAYLAIDMGIDIDELEAGDAVNIHIYGVGVSLKNSKIILKDGRGIVVEGVLWSVETDSNDNTKDIITTSMSQLSIEIERKFPSIKFACESQNRLWGCSEDGHEIYASAEGKPHIFYDFSGIATDSYAVTVGTDGEFTGCVNFNGKPHFFKENALHVISGSYPTNGGTLDGMSYAATQNTEFKGVEKGSERSLVIIDNILYYKSAAGVVAYDGTSTVVISNALGKEKYKNAVAGAYNSKYYVSMQDSAGIYHLFVYDTRLGTWSKEDNIHVLQFLQVKNELLFLTVDNKVYSVEDSNVLNLTEYTGEGDFDWECETGDFGYSYPNNKYLSRLQIRMGIVTGAKASIFVQYNSDGVWHRKGEITGNGISSHLIPIVPVRCDHMKIKITGKGDAKIYSIAKIFEEGGDV